ncbi:MAG: hypothetical protein JST91_29670 [Actinobacteria bacterium]|nr:hypothetical protein [Actinomycetota bacterium]
MGAVTTEWDRAHSAVSAMGDRFVLLRMDSTENRLIGGRQAIANTGDEVRMRTELASAVAAVLTPSTPGEPDCGTPFGRADRTTTGAERGMDDRDVERLLRAANLVTLARTAVMRDRSGNVLDAHAPEMPTRFAKQLTQLVRGGVSVGMSTEQAMGLAIRCARDSMPPLRLAILTDLAEYPRSLVTDVRRRLDKPHNTIDRELQALHMLGLVTLCEQAYNAGTRWLYSIRDGIDTTAVFPEMSVPPHPQRGYYGSSDISGNGEDRLKCVECDDAADPGWFRCSRHRTPTSISGNSPRRNPGTIGSEAK